MSGTQCTSSDDCYLWLHPTMLSESCLYGPQPEYPRPAKYHLWATVILRNGIAGSFGRSVSRFEGPPEALMLGPGPSGWRFWEWVQSLSGRVWRRSLCCACHALKGDCGTYSDAFFILCFLTKREDSSFQVLHWSPQSTWNFVQGKCDSLDVIGPIRSLGWHYWEVWPCVRRYDLGEEVEAEFEVSLA